MTGPAWSPARAAAADSSAARWVIVSGDARSALVSASTPRFTPMSRAISRCSTVWGLMPSFASTASKTARIPVAPEIIARTKRSWPGRSTRSISPASPASSAKPGTMETPLNCSSLRRSVSTPVSARTRAVLPWST